MRPVRDLVLGDGVLSTLGRGFAVLGAIAAWFVHLNVSYLFVPWACRWGSTWPLHVVTVALTAPAILAGLLSWVILVDARERGAPHPARDNRRLWGLAGVVMSAMFTTTIGFVWLSTMMIDPCA